MQKEERVNMCQALEEWYQDALKKVEKPDWQKAENLE